MGRTVRSILVIAIGLAWPIDAARAIDLMTGDGYLLALTQPDDGRSAAENQVAGTLETLMVVNEVLSDGESSLFCLSDERAAVIDVPLLRSQFTDWLRATPTVARGEPTGGLPVSLLALVFLTGKFPCAGQGMVADPNKDADIRSRLLRSVPN